MVNAFWLNRDAETAAAWLVDSHVTSSVLECSMVLTTALSLVGFEDEELIVTHSDHPLTQWAAHSRANWERLRAYTEAAHDEWRYRWDHGPDETHGSWERIETIDERSIPDLDWPSDEQTDPPQVTGTWDCPDYVDAYRYYYANEKRHLFSWNNGRRSRPGSRTTPSTLANAGTGNRARRPRIARLVRRGPGDFPVLVVVDEPG